MLLKCKVLLLLFVAFTCLLGDSEIIFQNNGPEITETFNLEEIIVGAGHQNNDNGEKDLVSRRKERDKQKEFNGERASMENDKVSGFHRDLLNDAFSDRKLTTMAESPGKPSEPLRNRRNVLSPAKQRSLKLPSRKPTSPITSQPITTSVSSSSSVSVISQPGPFPPPPLSPIPHQFVANCSSTLSCRGRCQNHQMLLNSNNKNGEYMCHCDDQCEMFQDCCADFDLFCPLPNNSLPSSADSHWNCHSDIWMIDQCPANWPSNQVQLKCITENSVLTRDNYADVIPVVSRNGKTYRNRFCALCHGENSDSIEHYALDFNSNLSPPQGYSTKEAIEFLFEYSFKIQWRPKQGQHWRKCIKVKNSCTLGDEFMCIVSPTRVVYHKLREVNYKNAYCASCNMPSDEPITSLTCGPWAPFGPPKTMPASFSIIMNTGGNVMGSKYKDRVAKVKCIAENEIYDSFLDLCRPVIQSPSILTTSQFDKYRIALWVQYKFPLSFYGNNVVSNFLRTFFALHNNTQIDIIHWQNAYVEKKNIETLIFEVQLWERVQPRRISRSAAEMSIESLLNFTRPVRFVFQNDSFIIIKATSRLLTCVHMQYFTAENYVVLHGSSSIYINQTQELLTEKQYFANSTKAHNGYQIPVGLIAVCRQHVPSTLTCNGTYISLDKDEYVMLPNNSVYRNVSNTIYNQGEYININGSVVVCTNYSNRYIKMITKTQTTVESQNDKALRILTYIGLSLSVICLVIVLVTYLLFEELRTLPGINLMNLSSALLVAHFVWLIGSGQTGSHGACVAIAVILHFSFLASFVWMSIIAFSTWKIFSSVQKEGTSSGNESRKKKIRYTLAIGWLPALVLVLICLSLDQSGAIKIEYGGAKGCWINNGRANLFIFVLPITASVVWNVVFFGLTVKALRKVTQQTRMVKEQRNYITVYVKIAVLMGFTWIFGLLASFVSSYFTYPFVALNTIQGVYIAVCFTFTRRVKNLYMTMIDESQIKRRSKRKTENVNQLSTDTCTTRL